jgi:ribonuclease HI
VSKPSELFCYTDGSCKAGHQAPGGWGFVLRTASGPFSEGYGSAVNTLAKVMEYQAVAEALAVVPEGSTVNVFSDNQALVENLEKRLASWALGGFTKVDPTIVESVRRIASALHERKLNASFRWLRAHNGNAGNERADALAARGAREAKAQLAEQEKLAASAPAARRSRR